MPVPQHVFDPPFNIIRSSHAVLDVTDLKLSREFYETTVGLHVEDADDNAVYLRAAEEHQHHSLVLRKAAVPAFAFPLFGPRHSGAVRQDRTRNLEVPGSLRAPERRCF